MCVSTALPGETNVMGDDLYNYLHKKGSGGGLWTKDLERMFGKMKVASNQ